MLHILSPESPHPLLHYSSRSSGIPTNCCSSLPCFPGLAVSLVSDPSLGAATAGRLSLGTGDTVRRPPRHVAIPAIPTIPTELRWIPAGAIHRANRFPLSPRHSLAPNLPGAHHAFLLTWTWQRRFQSLPGTSRDAGKKGGPQRRLHPSPGSPGTAWGAPQRHAQEPRVGGSRSCTYLVPGAEAAAPAAAAAAAAAGPRRGFPSAGSARSERLWALLRRPVGSPFSPCCCRCYPSRLRPVGRELAGTPPTRWASQRFNSPLARLMIQPASARQNGAVTAARRHEPWCFWYPAAPTRSESDSLELGKLCRSSAWILGPAWLILWRRSAATSLGAK